MAIDFLTGELKLNGVFHTAMAQLAHYFTPFQTFVVGEAESDRGRFDMVMALEILAREARYRAEGATAQGIFLYEFESLRAIAWATTTGLQAIAGDPMFDVSLARVDRAGAASDRTGRFCRPDLRPKRALSPPRSWRRTGDEDPRAAQRPVLFGEGEGRIALANRGKDPLLLFAALHRHLGYPEVPRPAKARRIAATDAAVGASDGAARARLKLVEEEPRAASI